ncbi:hypothetical protein [Streptomyces natalensis]|uniref:Uncharacterized protein n=1 Tax=Streptomyces natalensis ATCC 27448 TaxID=1240678 RepID=A0A0D7CNK7_9ACTN|nr:hypothetical protein [Streptomyces natalensis]KIZ17773.1 hypothetical protein SNA_12335 [Streptomyces natalensis ATCC 27448]
MARLELAADVLVVRLAWWERVVARRGSLRVPLGAVAEVSVQEDWWRAVRGTRVRGLKVPGSLCLGEWRHRDGRDFLALAPRRGPVVRIELRPTAPFSRIAVTVSQASQVWREAASRTGATGTGASDVRPLSASGPSSRP